MATAVLVRNQDGLAATAANGFTYVTVPPPTPGNHPYFARLCDRPDHFADYSMRDPWMLETRANGGYSINNSLPPAVTYDAGHDAAKITIPPGGNSLRNQVRFPIPPHGGQSLFAPIDVKFTDSCRYAIHGIPTHKAWQFGSPANSIHMEIRMRYAMGPPGSIGVIDGRFYGVEGPNVTATSTLAPRVGTFVVWPNIWVRLFPFFKAPSTADGWWEYSLWALDGSSATPVLIYDRLQVKPHSTVDEWDDDWLEYNTSTSWETSNKPNRPAYVAYARNMVMLKGLDDPRFLLLNEGL